MGAIALFPYEIVPEERKRSRDPDLFAEHEEPVPVLAPDRPLEAAGAAALQRSAGNEAVSRVISQSSDGERGENPDGRWMTLVPSPRRAVATARALEPPAAALDVE